MAIRLKYSLPIRGNKKKEKFEICFSLAWIEQILIWAVIVVAVVAIIKILIALVLPQLGWGGSAIMNIVMWAVIANFVLVICFDLIGCLISHAAHMSLP
jgi:hypothetical protein